MTFKLVTELLMNKRHFEGCNLFHFHEKAQIFLSNTIKNEVV